MRPLPEFRSSAATTTTTPVNKPLTNGDTHTHTHSDTNNKSLSNGSPTTRPLIVTRSKTGKVLRSGRRPLVSSPWKKPKEDNDNQCTHNTVNGYANNLKNRALNGISRSQRRTKKARSASSSPAKIGSAYAKHYKSYRRNSSTCRRNMLLGVANRHSRSPSTTPQQTRRSLKFKSAPNSGRLRLRDLNKDKNPPQKRNGGSGSSVQTQKPKSYGAVNGLSQSQSTKSRSASSSSSSASTQHSSSSGKDKEKAQRRSALWVLNCEAEEFLFGETAADKHELELPPSCTNAINESPPPKKRRRWRETELSHLLETSPFLESKLRSSSSLASFPSDNGDKVSTTSCSPPSPKKNSINGRHALHDVPKKRVKTKLHFESPTKAKVEKGSEGVVEVEEPIRTLGSPFNLNMELLSPRPYVDRAFLVQETLDNVNWKFSFENPPVGEIWYSTFNRREDSIMSHKSLFPSSISSSPVLLPYQMDKLFLRRSRKKLPKNARKSPRCHASTLAILSSEPPLSPQSPSPSIRSTRNSMSSTIPPPPPPIAVPPPTPVVPSVESLLISTTTTNVHPPPLTALSPFTKFVSDNSVRVTRKRNSSCQDPYQLYQRTQKAPSQEDFSAQQYLWDSIQFLSDHYVVALLAGDEPSPQFHIHSPTYKSSVSTRARHASSKMVQSSSSESVVVESRKASLRSCDGAANCVPVSKGSPNKSTNGMNGMSVPHPLRSPTTRSTTKPPSPPNTTHKSKRPPTPTAVLTVCLSDICKGGAYPKKGVQQEGLLFLGDDLPQLPSWPV